MTKILDTLLEGVLPDFAIEELFKQGILIGCNEKHIQPASIDLVLDLNNIYEIDAFPLPKQTETIDDLLSNLLNQARARQYTGKMLKPYSRYLIKLKNSIANSPYFGRANPKSSTGRIFNHCRLLADKTDAFDTVPIHYTGPLWIMVMPKFFKIKLSEDEPLNQLRFFKGNARLSGSELKRVIVQNASIVRPSQGNLFPEEPHVIEGNVGTVALSVDFQGTCVCYKTVIPKQEMPAAISLTERNAIQNYYFETVTKESLQAGGIVLEEGYGYLFSTREHLKIPANFAVEVLPISDRYGEVRTHFAGFIDPGFGYSSTEGNTVTLEVVSYEPGVLIRHGQTIAEVQFEHMAAEPKKLYEGNYPVQGKGPKLSKYFLSK